QLFSIYTSTRAPACTPGRTLIPYTTLFRSAGKPIAAVCEKPEVWQTWRADPIRHHTLMQRYAQFKALYLNDLHYRQH
nr:hypothetical protein [Klebsiella pneumoniae]